MPNDKHVLVLKIGGNQVEDEAFLAGFVAAVKALLAEYAVIVVHGGGKEIADLHDQLGVQLRDGRRAARHRRREPAAGRDGAQRHRQHPAGALAGQRRAWMPSG